MKDVLKSISYNDALILTAPPGWGKTYKILKAVKESKVKTVFVFPLRALCDEVYLSALDQKIKVLNLRNPKDYELVSRGNYDLILATPELIQFCDIFSRYTFILDEFHLFYYWGDSFRQKMSEVYMEITSYSVPIIFLSATLNEEMINRLDVELKLNYDNIYRINFGNQRLKNLPDKLYFYPKLFHHWIEDDYLFSKGSGTSLIFCKYRNEVSKIESNLKHHGFKVLSCIGGGAAEFIEKLNNSSGLDFIVATSVVSHGVNLPSISNLYFTYEVDHLDFYLQMLGRGGRDGASFNVHTKNTDYFNLSSLIMGGGRTLIKRLSNKINSLLYYLYAC